MKRLLFLALVVFAAWYGWHHYADLRLAGSHDVLDRWIDDDDSYARVMASAEGRDPRTGH